ncbi:glycoside hydrolase family 3 N-terminal domain-containing protein [Demequina sp. SO4-18]|uniref:glycoside hydrolase family 3 N-terminal domain-containing protein n=1 Tax=Demequina sp. SO4-18 TaxID=3401026 RepID=UPI003B5BB7B9
MRGIAAIAGVGLAISVAGCSADETEDPQPSETAAATGDYTEREVSDGTTDFVIVENPNGGAQLSYGAEGGMTILEEEVDGSTYAFKDMNANGELDPFEDWRLEPAERAADLAPQLSVEQISGLMLFSSHEGSPGDGLTEPQETYLAESHLRNVLNAGSSDVEDNVTWVNEMQAYVESLATADAPYVPANFSSDPRSEAGANDGYTVAGEGVSLWPSILGLASTFSAETVEEFGRIVSEEYRSLGISNALSPQIDLATEPRWLRVSGTLGENPELASELAAAYVKGFQGTYDEDGELIGFGLDSVPTTIKHAPGDGAGEGGRESHTDPGKYAVFPGDNFEEHAAVFAAASDALALMTNYSIMVDGDGEPLLEGEAVGTAYSPEKMAYIRDEIGFEGAIVTDWGVMENPAEGGTGWGTDELEPVERYFEVIANGTDMFGGVNDSALILEAYDLWTERFEAGEVDIDADTRWQESGTRILTNYFAPGLVDSPFVELEQSLEVVGAADSVQAGYDAQLDSVVLAKNDGVIVEGADWSDKTVYIPHTSDDGFPYPWAPAQYTEGPTMDIATAEEIFGTVLTDEVELDDEGVITSITAPDLSGADLALVGLRSPNNGNNFSASGVDAETGEWYPFSLQWRPYTADGDNVRQTSIAGDTLEDGSKENRSYFGNTSRIGNEADIDAFDRAVDAIEAAGGDIPLVTVVKANNPVVPTEFEAQSNAVIVGFGVSDAALIDILVGSHEPQGRLPIGFPASMDAVEAQQEDVGQDMETYVDAAGNDWAFGFGLDYSGVISD